MPMMQCFQYQGPISAFISLLHTSPTSPISSLGEQSQLTSSHYPHPMSTEISKAEHALAKLTGKTGPWEGVTIHSDFGVKLIDDVPQATLIHYTTTCDEELSRKMTDTKRKKMETYVSERVKATLSELEASGQYKKGFFCAAELDKLVQNYTVSLRERIRRSGMTTATRKTASPDLESSCQCSSSRIVDAQSLKDKCMGIVTQRYGPMGIFCDSRYHEVVERDVVPVDVLRTCESSKHEKFLAEFNTKAQAALRKTAREWSPSRGLFDQTCADTIDTMIAQEPAYRGLPFVLGNPDRESGTEYPIWTTHHSRNKTYQPMKVLQLARSVGASMTPNPHLDPTLRDLARKARIADWEKKVVCLEGPEEDEDLGKAMLEWKETMEKGVLALKGFEDPDSDEESQG